jgi:hypothetical protein
MNTRNSKKCAIEKISTVATTKRTRNNQEEQASLDNLDDLLINDNVSQVKPQRKQVIGSQKENTRNGSFRYSRK